jgi:drug/metabolite transporter (DMT)-like permease
VFEGKTGRPALRGSLFALLAAVLFGGSTPIIQHLGRDVGPFTTAALLYAGASLVGAFSTRTAQHEAGLVRTDIGRLLAMAGFGAVLGPVALAWGVQRASATSASLLLTFEALFTAVLAFVLYRETIDRRVAAAMALLTAGGVVLIFDHARIGTSQLAGLLAILTATLAWAFDNALSRGLADRDPGRVVIAKALLGASFTTVLAVVLGEPMPSPLAIAGLFAVGATGYGLSLRLYLLAQRAFGAIRTGSVFAFAPFIGAALAIGMGDRSLSWLTAMGALLMLAGVVLHLAESHAHEHIHAALEHEHAHRHDDGHHGHVHDPMPDGAHSHWHAHAPHQHAHPHVPDAHHVHRH